MLGGNGLSYGLVRFYCVRSRNIAYFSHRLRQQRMDVSAIDLEEMDEDEREELEAMLYAQVHHAAPDGAEVVEPPPTELVPPLNPEAAKIGQLKKSAANLEERRILTNGFDHSPPTAVKDNAQSMQSQPETAVDGCLPAVKDTLASTVSSQQPCGGMTPNIESNTRPTAETDASQFSGDMKPPQSGPMDPASINRTASTSPPNVSIAISPSPTPSSATVGEPSRSGPARQPLQDPAHASASPTPSAGTPKRPLSPDSSEGEPETKTAALAAGERRRHRRRRRRQPEELVTVHGSSSGSSTDEYVMEAGQSRSATGPDAVPSATAGPSGAVSPDVIAIDESSSTAPEVISLGGDSQPPSPKPSSASSAAASTIITAAAAAATSSSAPATPSSSAASAAPSAVRPRPAATEAGKTRQKLPAVAPSGRVRSVGGPAETPRQRRPRTSSDLSSSEADSDGGAALVTDCDITMNVLGAGPAGATSGGQGRPDLDVQELADDGKPALPTPACQRILASAAWLKEAQRRRLKPLCRSRPCFKWGDRQRAGYTTPRHYGPGDVTGIQATMSERGWDIPVEYLQRSAGNRAAKARYYSNLLKNRCRRCDDIGHVMAACPLPPVCHLCGQKGHKAEFRCRNLFCYMCGRRDHPTQRCPRHVQPVFCALCKSSGHASEQCADRWRRYHATTSAGRLVRPPSSLENRSARHVFCWECGARGHHGHQCSDERYTSAASLSQHVISYTETVCASREVPGLVATPAQMDAVFAPGRRRRLERQTGAVLTYEQLGDKAWLINISGSLAAARAAHEHVQAILQGKKRPRPRPSSAPASPAQPARPGGSTSLPVSPQPAPDAPDGRTEGRKAAKERRRLQKTARLAERRQKRQARAAARQAAAASQPAVIDLDSRSADDCVELPSGEVTVLEEVPASAAAAARRGGTAVQTVTIGSDEEGPGAAIDELTETEQGLDLTLLRSSLLEPVTEPAAVGPGTSSDGGKSPYVGEPVKLSKGQRRTLRKRQRKALLDTGGLTPGPSTSAAGTSQTVGSTPVTSRGPNVATLGANAKARRKEKRRLKMAMLELEMKRIAETKASLPPALLARLPPDWESRPNWRLVLHEHGVRHTSIPRQITKDYAKGYAEKKASKIESEMKERMRVKAARRAKAEARREMAGVDREGTAGKAKVGKKKKAGAGEGNNRTGAL